MADNVTLPGAGVLVRSEEKTGAAGQRQVFRLDVGLTASDEDIARGAVPIKGKQAAAATVTSPTVQETAANILAAQGGRRGAIICNNVNQPMYVRYGGTASPTSYTTIIPSNGGVPGNAYTWEMPEPIFTGTISAVWGPSPVGNANVTELT